MLHETIRNDDILADHSATSSQVLSPLARWEGWERTLGTKLITALQCWNNVATIRNNFATLCCAKNRRCESSPGLAWKTADISRLHQRFPREMRSEKQTQKFHTDNASLPRSG